MIFLRYKDSIPRNKRHFYPFKKRRKRKKKGW